MRKETFFSFLIACAIILGAIWIFSQSISHSELLDSQKNRLNPNQQSAYSHTEKSERNIDGPSSNAVDSNSNSREKIFKCAMKEKIIYSDKPCPAKTEQRNLTLNGSSGIISPPKENLEELTAKRLAAEAAYRIINSPKENLEELMAKRLAAEAV